MINRELLGFVGGALILLSMCFSTKNYVGTVLLRSFNALGSLVYIVYGIWIEGISIVVLNAICLVLNIVHLLSAVKDERNRKKVSTKCIREI